MKTAPWGLPTADLDEIVERSSADLQRWRGARLLVTGGTGFLGCWLVASLLWAEEVLQLGLQLEVLTRRPAALPLSPSAGLTLVEGDVRALPALGPYDGVIHAAAVSSAKNADGSDHPLHMAATIVDGTRAVLDVAAASRARVLFVSSGAVYGPFHVAPVREDDTSAPDPTDQYAAYGGAKRLAETWCAARTADGELDAVIARPFSFVGPGLPREGHFAVGNFLTDVMEHRPIRVSGDGKAVRSYLYMGELTEWLLAIFARGTSGRAYNVGSPEKVTIAQLAEKASRLADPPLPVEILGARAIGQSQCYVPDVGRAEIELGLRIRVTLDDALARTLSWLRQGSR